MEVLLLLLLFAGHSMADGEGQQPRPKRPHIVFVLADDLGWNDVSFHGSPQIPTPNIDALASDGVILNNYYACSICTPSRSSLLTGLYPIHTGNLIVIAFYYFVVNNIGTFAVNSLFSLQHFALPAAGPWGLPLELPTLPEMLKGLGYSTHLVGKWHLGFAKKEYTPLFRGFESHLGYYTGMHDYMDHINRELYAKGRFEGNDPKDNTSFWMEGLDFRYNLDPIQNATGKYTTHMFTERALDIIGKHNTTTPLFLLMSHLAVHRGNPQKEYFMPPEYADRFPHIKDPSRRAFAGSLTALDDSVGQVFSSLQQAGMLDDTIFIFTSDNGGDNRGFSSNSASNWPLRGQKFTLWEGGLRTVALLWSPRLPRKSQGKAAMQMMHITDWMPTLFSAAGGDVSSLPSMDGINLWESLRDNTPSPRQEILLNIDPVWGTAAIRVGQHKLILGSSHGGKLDGWFGESGREEILQEASLPGGKEGDSLVSRILSKRGATSVSPEEASSAPLVEVVCDEALRESAQKCRPAEGPCLFDITKDPCELNDIAAENPEVVLELLKRLRAYHATSRAPLTRSLDSAADPKGHGGIYVSWLS